MHFAGDHGPEDSERAQQYGQELVAMNAAALAERYGDEGGELAGEELYQFKDALGCTYDLDLWQLLKSLDCYLYQCSEGDVVESELFKGLSEFRDRFSRVLVASLPQYNAATWG